MARAINESDWRLFRKLEPRSNIGVPRLTPLLRILSFSHFSCLLLDRESS